MTTSEIPHHRHRYPQGDLPPLATPGKTTPQTAPRGAKQIVIPMTQQQYDDIWHDADRVRSFIEQLPRVRLRSCFRRASTKAIACTALGVSL